MRSTLKTRCQSLTVAAAWICAGVTVATPVSAQVMAEPIRKGVVQNGRLEEGSPVHYTGAHYQIYPYTARAGEQVVIDLMSDEFDAYVSVGHMPEGATSHEDLDRFISKTDGGNNKDARLVFAFPKDGTYGILASSYNKGELGAYRIVMWDEASAPTVAPAIVPEVPATLTTVRLGEAVRGVLDSSSPIRENRRYKLFWYVGQAGDKVVVTTRSPAFRPMVGVYGPFTGTPRADLDLSLLEYNIGGGGDGDALLSYTFPRTGLYLFRAQSVDAGQSGPFSFALFRAGTQEPRITGLAGADRPSPAPSGRTPASGRTPTVRSLAEAVALTTNEARGEGLSLAYSETARLTRPEDFEVIARVKPGEQYVVMVLDENGLSAATIYYNIMQDNGGRLEKASEMVSITGPSRRLGPVLRTAGGLSINRDWPTGTPMRITINAGPAFGHTNDVQIMVFKK